MDVEPSRMNKRKNTIMDLTTSRYDLRKKSRKNISSSTPYLRPLPSPLPSAQVSLVPISSDVDLPNTGQGNTNTDVNSSFMVFACGQDKTNTNVSYGFMAFASGNSGFMSFSPTKLRNRPIPLLNFNNTEKAVKSAFFREDPRL
ncbi:hypothetical protein H0E87_031362 [Populus deltoides]|uniref:Uncharacterized protein n=1 Tax=Populus deltoides TaxID=3696 RepID=A0A8T2WE00_POPDE|nr:hypothetical protein H0E87_031362 [Populus deltoides]